MFSTKNGVEFDQNYNGNQLRGLCPDFYGILASRMVGSFEGKVARIKIDPLAD